MSLDDDITLSEPAPEHPRIVQARADGWVDASAARLELHCGPCGNAVGLMTRGLTSLEVQCKGCIVYGHPSFAGEDELPYEGAPAVPAPVVSPTCFLVQGAWGEYEDYQEWIVRAFLDKGKAGVLREELQAWVNEHEDPLRRARGAGRPGPTNAKDPRATADAVYTVVEVPLEAS